MILRLFILTWILAPAAATALHMRSEPIDQVVIAIGFIVITSILLVIAAAHLRGPDGACYSPKRKRGSNEVCMRSR